ncbi:hypothetical protein F4821DRAFT_276090 [Hypoxylon rubiginosum]|uniref:Uncharacterized protein n=1 Tax=Hypoxylon rubiginosum TaxID=110542 RepID=A0ACC0D9N4_9PEZI|nr:hypothetical protein F4821DRAFT_276090 [Hypoxylon rubiginosum]
MVIAALPTTSGRGLPPVTRPRTRFPATTIMNIFTGLNSTIWNSDNWDTWWDGAGLCDIQIYLQQALYTAFAASIFAIIHHLAEQIRLDCATCEDAPALASPARHVSNSHANQKQQLVFIFRNPTSPSKISLEALDSPQLWRTSAQAPRTVTVQAKRPLRDTSTAKKKSQPFSNFLRGGLMSSIILNRKYSNSDIFVLDDLCWHFLHSQETNSTRLKSSQPKRIHLQHYELLPVTFNSHC